MFGGVYFGETFFGGIGVITVFLPVDLVLVTDAQMIHLALTYDPSPQHVAVYDPIPNQVVLVS